MVAAGSGSGGDVSPTAARRSWLDCRIYPRGMDHVDSGADTGSSLREAAAEAKSRQISRGDDIRFPRGWLERRQARCLLERLECVQSKSGQAIKGSGQDPPRERSAKLYAIAPR